MSNQATTTTETIDVHGAHLVAKVKELIHAGNVRRINIKDSEGNSVLDMPVSVGVIGFLVAPTMTAIGTLGALAADYSIEVERGPRSSDDTVITPVEQTNGAEREDNPMSAHRTLLDRYVELYNAGDLDGVMDLYAEDASQLMPEGLFEGRGAIRDRLAREIDSFSDLAHRVVSYVEGGDAFADECVFVGTHTGPIVLPDGTEVPATGKRIEISCMEYVKVRDGKIVVDNMYYDNLAVAAQLGLLPTPAPAAM
jgi:steroid delta-isomerase-like uncharacterized protein